MAKLCKSISSVVYYTKAEMPHHIFPPVAYRRLLFHFLWEGNIKFGSGAYEFAVADYNIFIYIVFQKNLND